MGLRLIETNPRVANNFWEIIQVKSEKNKDVRDKIHRFIEGYNCIGGKFLRDREKKRQGGGLNAVDEVEIMLESNFGGFRVESVNGFKAVELVDKRQEMFQAVKFFIFGNGGSVGRKLSSEM